MRKPSSSSCSNSNRLRTIFKKASELSTLCDNEICVIHFGRREGKFKTWPENHKVRDIALRYSKLDEAERRKKSADLYGVLKEQNMENLKKKKKKNIGLNNKTKIQDLENLNKKMNNGFKYPISDHYSPAQVPQLVQSLEVNLSYFLEKVRLEKQKKTEHSSTPSSLNHPENQTPFSLNQHQDLITSSLNHHQDLLDQTPFSLNQHQDYQDPTTSSLNHHQDQTPFPLNQYQDHQDYQDPTTSSLNHQQDQTPFSLNHHQDLLHQIRSSLNNYHGDHQHQIPLSLNYHQQQDYQHQIPSLNPSQDSVLVYNHENDTLSRIPFPAFNQDFSFIAAVMW